MLLTLTDVLDHDQLQSLWALMAQSELVDGRLSAGKAAERVKQNQEVAQQAPQLGRMSQIVVGSLIRHPRFRNATLFHRVAAPFFARYGVGMAYGAHVDDPVMGTGERYRSDISVTLFLNDPASYDGGELAIETPFGTQQIKGEAGSAVIYPSSSLHQILEVTRGERLVAVTWVQSLIREESRRQLLYELGEAREMMMAERPDAPETAKVGVAYTNLVRMWAEL